MLCFNDFIDDMTSFIVGFDTGYLSLQERDVFITFFIIPLVFIFNTLRLIFYLYISTPPIKHLKTKYFLIFPGSMEMKYWPEMG